MKSLVQIIMLNFIKYQIKNNISVPAYLVINMIIPVIFTLVLLNVSEISLASDFKIASSKFSLLYSVSFVIFIFSLSYWIIAKPRRVFGQFKNMSKYGKISKISKKDIKLGNAITDGILAGWIILVPSILYLVKVGNLSSEFVITICILIMMQFGFYLISEIILVFVLNKRIEIKSLTIIFLAFTFLSTSITKLSIYACIKDLFFVNIINTVFKNNFINRNDVINLLPLGGIIIGLAIILMIVRNFFEKENNL